MYKVSDFFVIEAYFEIYNGTPVLHFYWDEGGEEYIYDWLNKKLLVGDKNNFTFEIITDWFEDHIEEIDELFRSEQPFYIKDILT